LSELEQDANQSKDLESCAAALVQDAIINHKEKDVKIFAACCLADVIRIYAPEAPYDDNQLQVRLGFL
jgi:sister-chromatid-cohesion protein PDS5